VLPWYVQVTGWKVTLLASYYYFTCTIITCSCEARVATSWIMTNPQPSASGPSTSSSLPSPPWSLASSLPSPRPRVQVHGAILTLFHIVDKSWKIHPYH
jgi:hypothetical protein